LQTQVDLDSFDAPYPFDTMHHLYHRVPLSAVT
jgi:hypothetical protein